MSLRKLSKQPDCTRSLCSQNIWILFICIRFMYMKYKHCCFSLTMRNCKNLFLLSIFSRAIIQILGEYWLTTTYLVKPHKKKKNWHKTDLPIWPILVLLGKFQKCHFCPLIISGYAEEFKNNTNNPSNGSCGRKLCNFGPKWA